jgi:hypothetical protein
MTRARQMGVAVARLSRRPPLLCEGLLRLALSTNHSWIILYAITGCITGLFAMAIITGVGTLVYLVLPRNVHARPVWYGYLRRPTHFRHPR